MSNRKAEILAWSLFALCVTLGGAALVLSFFATQSKDVQQFGATNVWGELAFVVPILSLPLIGGFLAGRVPRNPVGWLLLASGISWMATAFHDAYLSVGEHIAHRIPPGAAWLALIGWVPGLTLLLIFTLLFFPNGKLPSRRWRPLLWAAVVLVPLMTFATALSPAEPGKPLVGVPNMLRPLIPLAEKMSSLLVTLPILFLASAASLIVRSRRASPDDRAKLKWILFGGLVAVLYFAFAFASSLAFDKPGAALAPLAHFLQSGLFFALAAIPISIGFAVLRYRLYEIDRIISRTLSYVLVSIVLAAIYVLVVLVPTSVLSSGGGAPPWLVAVGTLAVALMFSPVRTRLQGIVDRRFNRRRYDAARVLEDFGTRLRQQVDLDELRPALEGVIVETMNPSKVGLWLAP